jgi:hypothetical protein
MYDTQSEGLKNVKKRLNLLTQKVNEMTWYWKIRCKEREQSVTYFKRAKLILSHLKNMEKNLKEPLGKKLLVIKNSHNRINSEQKRLFQLYLSANDANRLRQFLKLFQQHYFVTRRFKGKHLPWLSRSEYCKLKYWLKGGKNV